MSLFPWGLGLTFQIVQHVPHCLKIIIMLRTRGQREATQRARTQLWAEFHGLWIFSIFLSQNLWRGARQCLGYIYVGRSPREKIPLRNLADMGFSCSLGLSFPEAPPSRSHLLAPLPCHTLAQQVCSLGTDFPTFEKWPADTTFPTSP